MYWKQPTKLNPISCSTRCLRVLLCPSLLHVNPPVCCHVVPPICHYSFNSTLDKTVLDQGFQTRTWSKQINHMQMILWFMCFENLSLNFTHEELFSYNACKEDFWYSVSRKSVILSVVQVPSLISGGAKSSGNPPSGVRANPPPPPPSRGAPPPPPPPPRR